MPPTGNIAFFSCGYVILAKKSVWSLKVSTAVPSHATPTFAYRVHGVGGNAVVILFLQVHDVELAAVFLSDISGYLDVFLRRTVHQILLALESYLDVKDMRVNALLLEERHYH